MIQIVEKPIIHTVEKIIERPVEKIFERPLPYPVYHKPDFHVIAKTVPTNYKLFDFDALIRFLTNKQEVKHIYIPASPRYQLNQLNKHQLLAAHHPTLENNKEAPLWDYSRYATSHLNPIKPIYGLPSSTVLQPVKNQYPYSGRKLMMQGTSNFHHCKK